MELLKGCMTGTLTIAAIFAFMFWLDWRMAPPYAREQLEAALRYMFSTIDRVNRANLEYFTGGEFMEEVRWLFSKDDDGEDKP